MVTKKVDFEGEGSKGWIGQERRRDSDRDSEGRNEGGRHSRGHLFLFINVCVDVMGFATIQQEQHQ